MAQGPVRDFLMDSTGDLAVVNGDFAVVAGQPAVLQGIATGVRMFLGECFLDESIGIDWFGQILVKNGDPLVARELIRQRIAAVPDVTSVLGAAVVIDANRRGNVTYQVATVYSATGSPSVSALAASPISSGGAVPVPYVAPAAPAGGSGSTGGTGSGSSYYQIIQGAGSPQPARAALNFGAGLTVVDDAVANRTTVSIGNGSITNSMLASSAVTVNAGAGLAGGGAVSLGGSTSISLPSVGTAGVHLLSTGDSVQTDTQGRVMSVNSTARSVLTATGRLVGGGALVAGDLTLDLATTGITPGTYNSVNIDAYGRATAGASIAYLTSAYYQTVQAAGSARTQRSALNFLALFTATDSGSSTDIGLAQQSGNTFLASPVNGSLAAPTFRTIALADLPSIPNSQLAYSSISITYAGTALTGSASVSLGGTLALTTYAADTRGSYSDPAWITSLAASKISGVLASANLPTAGTAQTTQIYGAQIITDAYGRVTSTTSATGAPVLLGTLPGSPQSGNPYITGIYSGSGIDTTVAGGPLSLGAVNAGSITLAGPNALVVTLPAAAASAGTTLVNPPRISWQGNYWSAGASHNYLGSIRLVMDSTSPAGHLELALQNTPVAQFTTGGLQLAGGYLLLGPSGGVQFADSTIQSTAALYQHVTAAGTLRPQEPQLNFAARLTAVDDPATFSTDIDLAASGVTAANYTNASITVDVYGRVTAASNGVAGGTFSTDYSATTPASNIVSLAAAGGPVLVYDNATPLGTTLLAVADSTGATKYLDVQSGGVHSSGNFYAGGSFQAGSGVYCGPGFGFDTNGAGTMGIGITYATAINMGVPGQQYQTQITGVLRVVRPATGANLNAALRISTDAATVGTQTQAASFELTPSHWNTTAVAPIAPRVGFYAYGYQSGVNSSAGLNVYLASGATGNTTPSYGASSLNLSNDGTNTTITGSSFGLLLDSTAAVGLGTVGATSITIGHGTVPLTISGTSPYITFGSVGGLAPTFTTRSTGTKLVLYGSVDATHADYAIGVDTSSGTVWTSVDQASGGRGFAWYGGTTSVMQLAVTTGILTLTGHLWLPANDRVDTSTAGTLSIGNTNATQIINKSNCAATGINMVVDTLATISGAGRIVDFRTASASKATIDGSGNYITASGAGIDSLGTLQVGATANIVNVGKAGGTTNINASALALTSATINLNYAGAVTVVGPVPAANDVVGYQLTLRAGQAGNATTAAGKAGGLFAVTGGPGGTGNSSWAAGPGGQLNLFGGPGGAAGTAGGGLGGAIYLEGGIPTGAANGGNVYVGTLAQTYATSIGRAGANLTEYGNSLYLYGGPSSNWIMFLDASAGCQLGMVGDARRIMVDGNGINIGSTLYQLGHIITTKGSGSSLVQPASPTAVFGAGAGTGPTGLTVTGTDVSGQISFTTGTATATGVIATITFGTAFVGTNPRITLTPLITTGIGMTLQLSASAVGLSSFAIYYPGALQASSQFAVAWHAIA